MSASPRPPLSIVTPVYNCEKYIVETVESVLAQGGPDLDYTVIDDGSSDGTLALLRPYADRLRLVSRANKGEPATVNEGVALAANDIVGIVNADDPIRPGLLDAVAATLGSDPATVAVYPDWHRIDSSGRLLAVERTLDYDYAVIVEQLHCIPGPGAFFRKSALRGEPARNPAFRFTSDYDLWLRLGLRGPMRRIAEPLATWREHDEASTIRFRNIEMAHNRIDTVRSFFARPDLPAEVITMRDQALSSAYDRAALALHDPRVPGRRYYLASFWYKPFWPRRIPRERRRSRRNLLAVWGGASLARAVDAVASRLRQPAIETSTR
jgi:glycosyltransferase involved in cell wall biosynthesis